MKESKFIELLNLYIDQQISPEEAALLEEEILNNLRHRRIYHQYCKMHRACTLVLENMGAQADQGSGVEEVASRVVDFAPRAPRRLWGYLVAGLGAAACVALVAVQVFVRADRNSAGGGIVAARAASPVSDSTGLVKASAPVHVAATASPVSLRIGSPSAWPLLVFSPGNLSGRTTLVVKSPAEPVLPPPLAVDAASPSLRRSVEQFVFEEPVSIAGSPQVYRSRQQTDGQTEMSAFQFQR